MDVPYRSMVVLLQLLDSIQMNLQPLVSWYQTRRLDHQMVFVATAASIVSGTLAERIKLWSFLLFVVVLTAGKRSTLVSEGSPTSAITAVRNKYV
jgi:hypothetical protein